MIFLLMSNLIKIWFQLFNINANTVHKKYSHSHSSVIELIEEEEEG